MNKIFGFCIDLRMKWRRYDEKCASGAEFPLGFLKKKSKIQTAPWMENQQVRPDSLQFPSEYQESVLSTWRGFEHLLENCSQFRGTESVSTAIRQYFSENRTLEQIQFRLQWREIVIMTVQTQLLKHS